MNRERRERLEDVKNQIEVLKDELQDVTELEQVALDNLPESLQESRGESMQVAIDTLEDAISSLEEALDNIEQAM